MKTEKENAPTSNARVNERHWTTVPYEIVLLRIENKVGSCLGGFSNLALAPTGLADLDILSTFTSIYRRRLVPTQRG